MPEKMVQTGHPVAGGEAPAYVEPVRKQLRVKATPQRAFEVFTSGMDSWWPRTHHIGASPMKRVVIEERPGGAIYTEQVDGTDCPWGSVLAWDPPHRFLFAWHVRPDWTYEPDAARCSEVEVLFTPADDGTTLVELEHRHLERHGAGSAQMREQVNAEGGWGGLLFLFATKTEAGA